ncbi:MAG TPA: YncE family protein [Acidimicrobiales bacterium]|nr:YncE family protein [Acidimicrobiales bacterium]
MFAAVGLVAIAGAAWALSNRGGKTPLATRANTKVATHGEAARALGAVAPTSPPPTSTAPTTSTTIAAKPSTTRTLSLARTVTGQLSPKSVVASGSGLVFAQNMIYNHTVSIFGRDGQLVKTIPDSVTLSDFGYPQYPASVKGGPVEAAFSPDGKDAYVSNYSMYGPGFAHPGDDVCSPAQHIDSSFVYRIDVAGLAIDKVIPVGAVPKYVAVTPDGRYLLVSNWCSYNLSVIDTTTETEVKRIPLGPYPRGIAVDPQSRVAYVAVMGSRDVAMVSLADFTLTWIRNVGNGPRHLVMDPAGRYLYVTLNADGRTAKIDLTTDTVVARVATGSAPRSMTIAPDGESLYVVNYESATVTKVRAADMQVLQTVRTDAHPIGITYDAATNRLWVACYSGAIMLFNDA